MTDVGYLNNTLLRVLSTKEMDGKEAVVGQGGQVLCELGKLSKSPWREWPPLLVWSQKGRTVTDLVEVDLSFYLMGKAFLMPGKNEFAVF